MRCPQIQLTDRTPPWCQLPKLPGDLVGGGIGMLPKVAPMIVGGGRLFSTESTARREAGDTRAQVLNDAPHAGQGSHGHANWQARNDRPAVFC